MRALSAIRVGYSDNLITRAADVTLKERRRLVLVPREAPLSEIHLDNMHYLARVGAVIFPPTVAYCARPTSVKEVTTRVVGRVIDQLGIEHFLIKRWKDDQHPIPVNGDRQLAEADDRTTRLDDKPCRPHGR
jgi:flavin prenyltransferase